MGHILSVSLALFVPVLLTAQDLGGYGDGYGKLYLLNQNFIGNDHVLGGPGDGYSNNLMVKSAVEQDFTSGGSGDGYAISLKLYYINESICVYGGGGDGGSLGKILLLPVNLTHTKGGYGDGFDFITQNLTYDCSYFVTGGVNAGYYMLKHSHFIDQQYFVNGGINDGYCRSRHNHLNDQQYIVNGGINDGYCGLRYNHLIDQQYFVNGGINDGYCGLRYNHLIDQQHFVNGGINDGYCGLRYNHLIDQQYFVNGGINDGYCRSRDEILINYQNYSYAGGGEGEGHDKGSLSALLGKGVWKGLISPEWTTESNWLCQLVPDHTFPVTIPAGCTYYPFLAGDLTVNNSSGYYQCKSLDILSGGAITNTGGLSISGMVTVKGSYFALNSVNHSQNILPGGKLLLLSPGEIRLGSQIDGEGTTDLIINSGGSLEIHGGILEIDDQLNLMTGAGFEMDSGLVFVNKLGKGSVYDPSNPGAFYIAPGSSLHISGGLLKVCGRASNDNLTAINISCSSPGFTGTSTLEIIHGINPVHYNTDIKINDSASFMHLHINKPGNTVNIITNATIDGSLYVGTGSNLNIAEGKIVTISESTVTEH